MSEAGGRGDGLDASARPVPAQHAGGPAPPPSQSGDQRRNNPLSELITTESVYVAELSTVIRRVAAAWSPTNFPPPELDAMFRALEAVYRTNSTFLRSLNDIGPNPATPKGLGNLLIRWTESLYGPYSRYCHAYMRDFDSWAPIKSNAQLQRILSQLAAEYPRQPSPPTALPGSRPFAERWSLDALFLLPLHRVRFYKRLYSRLLRGTQPGRSDHQLLKAANEKLDSLLEIIQQREATSVLRVSPPRMDSEASTASSGVSNLDMDARGRSPSTSASEAEATLRTPVGKPREAPPRNGPEAPAPALATAPLASGRPADADRAAPAIAEVNAAAQRSSAERPPPSAQPRPPVPQAVRPAPTTQSLQQAPAPAPAPLQPPAQNAQPPVAPQAPQPAQPGQAPQPGGQAPQPGQALRPPAPAQASGPGAPPAESPAPPQPSKDATPQVGAPITNQRGRSLLRALRMQPKQTAPPPLDPPLEGQSLNELQRRVDSSQTLDIFSLQPKSCRLQIAPPSLPFQRTLRVADRARMKVVPTRDSPGPTVEQARLVLLTDIILVGEDLDASSTSHVDGVKKDIRLLFPPLAGRFLESSSVGEPEEHAILISVMRRAEMTVYLSSEEQKQTWLRELSACTVFAGGARPQPGQQPGPQPAPQPGPQPAPAIGAANQAPPPHIKPNGAPASRTAPDAQSAASAQPAPAVGAPAAPGDGMRLSGFVRAPPAGAFAIRPPADAAAAKSPTEAVTAPSTPGSGTFRTPGSPTRPTLPPLLLPNKDADEAGSEPPSAGPLQRNESVTSFDSFPKRPAGRGVLESPERMGAFSPTMQSPKSSPIKDAIFRRIGSRTRPSGEEAAESAAPGFPPAPGQPAGAVMRPPAGAGPGPSPLSAVLDAPRRPVQQATMPLPPKDTAPVAEVQQRRPSDSGVSAGPSRGPRRSVSQPRLRNLGMGAKLPSQMLEEGGRQASPEWLNQDMERVPTVRANTAEGNRRPSFTLCAQMRCKVFLKQSYAQWKSIGNARLRLYHLQPSGSNQLVVENDRKLIISTIVIADAVERVGKTGLAVELSDNGSLTGVVYMLHMRSEESASGLFEQLLLRSDRTTLSRVGLATSQPSSPSVSRPQSQPQGSDS